MLVALRGVSLSQLELILIRANYTWLLPTIIAILASHWLRGWRWKLMLAELPSVKQRNYAPSITTAFYAVLIGYMTNYIVSRIGEFVRVGNVALKEKLPFTEVLGTVISERLLDLVVSALAFLSLFWIAQDKLIATYQTYMMPFLGRMQNAIWILGLGFLVASFLGVWLLKRWRNQEKNALGSKVHALIEGLKTLYQTPHKVKMVISTLGIWFCYALIAHFSALLLHFPEELSWSLADSWVILMIGSLGILVPTPGGAGTFHVITRWALVTLWGISDEKAVAFAFFTHAIQMIVYAISGFLALLAQDIRFKDLQMSSKMKEE